MDQRRHRSNRFLLSHISPSISACIAVIVDVGGKAWIRRSKSSIAHSIRRLLHLCPTPPVLSPATASARRCRSPSPASACSRQRSPQPVPTACDVTRRYRLPLIINHNQRPRSLDLMSAAAWPTINWPTANDGIFFKFIITQYLQQVRKNERKEIKEILVG
ncbi:hypothetical protein ACLOJK_034026 [Asimina triloba]